MRFRYIRNSQGVALLAALFVLMVLSILGIGLLTNVDDEIKMSKSAENSEMALKVAEAGIQVARSTFVDPAITNVTQTEAFASIDGFYRGGYFLVQMESGFQGAEKWVQWRYDEGVTGHNPVSEISAPVFHVWRTGDRGVNGDWAFGTNFYVNPIYGIVARGTYFPIENASGDTQVRAHDEYSGDEKVARDTDDFTEALYYWRNDKTLTTTFDGLTVNYAVKMSPMVSFSNYSTRTGQIEPALDQQTLYFVYSGDSSNPPDSSGGTAMDLSSTVRLRAVNALCNGGANPNHTADDAPLKSLWEFDTKMHGVGSSPAFYDPDPDTPGDEILYFIVIEKGKAGSTGALDLMASGDEEYTFPSLATDDPEQIYMFAVVDTTGKPANCTSTGSYKLKWAKPFPDPDVMEWTDYPTEHATGTDGTDPPYVSRPSDMTPFFPEEDLLLDYRDGPGMSGGTPQLQVRTPGKGQASSAYDGQWNQIRGNIIGGGAYSPPVVKVLYRDSSGNLTNNRAEATSASRDDPLIDIYFTYTPMTRVAYLVPMTPPWVNQWYWSGVSGYHGIGWGPPGYRKPIACQTRVVALRDRLVRSGSSWNWKAAKSRYPIFKWTYRVPSWDPDQTYTDADTRPWNGYGEYTWDTALGGIMAPMIKTTKWDQNNNSWASVGNAGASNLYTVLYPYYKSAGLVTVGTENNTHGPGRTGPSLAQGSPRDFSATTDNTTVWTDSRIMLMAVRDTWDDYMAGNQTNPLFPSMAAAANPSRSNPAEPYWTHTDNNADPNTTLLTYNSTLGAQYAAPPAGTSKIGFPRPYAWWEYLWQANIRAAASDKDYSLFKQGWENVLSPTTPTAALDISLDVDVEGENAAICGECLQNDGLLILPFNHDLSTSVDGTAAPDSDGLDTQDREDLRIHAINATTGLHEWDYHMPSSLAGDDANNTPSIANNLVFVAYQAFGSGSRSTLLTILNGDDGSRQQTIAIDQNSDAIILPPTIANGAVYIGTYDFSGTPGNNTDDWIKLFALSPVIRLVSTGVYPFNYPGAEYPYGYKHYTGGAYPFAKITSLDHDKIFMNPTTGEMVKEVWKRKLQVWVTGQNSKWEEVREVLEE